MGNLEAAEPLLRQAVDIWHQAYGDESLPVAGGLFGHTCHIPIGVGRTMVWGNVNLIGLV